MNYALIEQEDINDLPKDNQDAFIRFERICRRNLNDILNHLNQNDNDNDVRLTYMGKVAQAAIEYGISGVEALLVPHPSQYEYSDYVAFVQTVGQMVTRLQIQKAKKLHADSLALPSSRLSEIEKYIEILRRRIEGSDFEDSKKKSLFKKLEALKSELSGKRPDLAKTMVIFASIATLVNQTEAAVIKLPTTITAIMQVIGMVKHDEEVEQAAIAAAAKPRAIEDKRPKPMQSKIPRVDFTADLDDEIPF